MKVQHMTEKKISFERCRDVVPYDIIASFFKSNYCVLFTVLHCVVGSGKKYS